MAESTNNPYDINGQHFNSDMYFQKLLKECTLKQIMDREAEIIKNTQALHSDMQTLVYENYNKFISATDTIRKMKTDFKEMEDSMDLLAKNMESITSFSEQISSTLHGTRQQIAKLSSVHTLLKKLQFLFKLPGNLKDKINEEKYAEAVQDYVHAQRVLNQYSNMPSFQGIQKDCEDILEELKSKLRLQFHKRDVSTKALAENIDLLLQLKEPADSLCIEFLIHAEGRLTEQLDILKDMCENDIIEFVDMASSGFLNNLCLIVTSYKDIFINRPLEDNDLVDDFEIRAVDHLNKFIVSNMKKYFDLMGKRVEDVADTAILVRALDKFHRKLQEMNMLSKETDFARIGTDLVVNAGRKQCRNHLHSLKQHLSEILAKVRQTLAAKVPQDSDEGLAELQAMLIMPTIEKVKGVLQDLSVFLQLDLPNSIKTQFLQSFCVDEVREGLVIGFLHHLTATVAGFCNGSDVSKFPPTLLLLLSKMCIEYKESNVRHLLTKFDDLFNIDQYVSSENIITPESEICDRFQEAAQNLLNHYVRIQGLAVSQMLRKSVETRDWLHTIEPRTVRAVMKRVVEDVTAIDAQVAALYNNNDGQVDRSSDSSRKTHSVSISRQHYRSNWSSYTPSHIDSSLVTNIHKLFSERIEIFSSVQFNKASILTGIIKISLKTFLEGVRLRTFSKYGLQQIQVDTHYLQTYLWPFVSDENVVHFLLDEILGSAVHRCLDPVLMEPSVVDIICERG
ncbi:vacuolar protein sorting-associated protein 51 homolog [Temnothorax curvispinosus]|uniref:Vacuolar protein sorting-associated protein 51 homolog n=1 Tax=Temnothorax curvispinosus TaxID=300111 RepID=A0A6J1QYT1_9HYME|nr:vacuolar protein sorting-associated protein 51 homolog [Temnothorax curvispinosus]XP_024887026.1 vacuolar protein sorting-associated protein 51 homolog [Temnothorax curvispinosus]XP_024887027.1 vacuolar protein sorting-associated protein 51 homolog [Temnothorax curvispinosus]XP_024887028.1 vacuolar protein sorting-associated protein 51 homolog [Temnothorax curvispinosus]